VLLREVSVENFRAFRHAGLRLPENGLVLIVGANNSGKSALLSALDVVAGDQGDVSSLKHVGSPGGCRVNTTMELENGRQNLSIAAGLQGNRPSPDSMDLVGADRSVGRPDWLDGLVHGSPQACWISEPLTKWRSSYYHFRALRQGTERSQGLASDKRLNPTGANLSAVLHGLVTDQLCFSSGWAS
jgi:energy-coupling factor transporter ATP-binding protein EcfA2